MKGIFTVSLDFELHWGVFDISDRNKRIRNYENTLGIIVPRMLELFIKYDVHATWATVGSMFARDHSEWSAFNPAILPQFRDDKISIYRWVEKNGLDNKYDVAHFATNEIKNILSSPGQEVGSHLFSHMYCNEIINRDEAFREDIRAAVNAGNKLGARIHSLTFPRNQIREDLLRICFEEGITAVRSNPTCWYFRRSNFVGTRALKKLVRQLDEYFPLGQSMLFSLEDVDVEAQQPVKIPRGRLFLPYNPENKTVNYLRLQRMIAEMYAAAKTGKCYQLWWHPEDFSDYPEENLESLEAVLKSYKDCQRKYGMQSWNLGEYAEKLSSKKDKRVDGRNIYNLA